MIGLTSFLSFAVSHSASASDLSFPNECEVAGSKIKLHGTGTRKATLFAIKVYHAAYYSSKNTPSLEDVLKDSGPKRLDIKYLRDFGLDDTNEAWNYQFKESSGFELKTIRTELDQLISYQKAIKEGDTQRFEFHSDRVVFFINGEKRGEIVGKNFQAALLTIFFGPNPPTQELQKGLYRGIASQKTSS